MKEFDIFQLMLRDSMNGSLRYLRSNAKQLFLMEREWHTLTTNVGVRVVLLRIRHTVERDDPWRSWLARCSDKAKVGGSNPPGSTTNEIIGYRR